MGTPVIYLFLSGLSATMASGTYKAIIAFDGSYESNFESFINRFEQYLIARQIDKVKNPQMAFAHLSLSLTDNAKIYFESIPDKELTTSSKVKVNGNEVEVSYHDYDKLVGKLRMRFKNRQTQGDLLTKLMRLRQNKGESVTAFSKRFYNRASGVILSRDQIEAENQMISLFINALNKKLKLEMLKNVNFYKTMQQAESQAILLEQIYGTHHDNPTNEA